MDRWINTQEPATNHAITCAIAEGKTAKDKGNEKVILMNWRGHGIIDLSADDAYVSGKLEDHAFPDKEIERLVRDPRRGPTSRALCVDALKMERIPESIESDA
jgi:hypothetical protein